MPFDLRANNLGGAAVIDQPGGVVATADLFIDAYSYAEQWAPELIPQLHMANGLGKITGLVRLLGDESTYEADVIEHMEEGRLHNIIKNVAEAPAGTFTSPTAHNLRVGDTIKISDGVGEWQGTVTAVTSTTVFDATNDADGTTTFGFAGNVDIICDFSNSYEKGSADPVAGNRWDPDPYYNYTHILKRAYNTSGSDMVHRTWVQTPYGPRWFNFEVQRTIDLFDNLVEMTHIFHERKGAGNAKGCNGMLSQIENRGNVANEYITDIEELSDIARRAKQQGGCREFTVWGDHQQQAYFRQMLAGVNAHYVSGAHYGTFANDRDMALMLEFKSVYIDGCTFHFTPWALLEDPTLMGNEKFRQTGLACLIVPSGNKMVQENGNSVSRPYFSVRYRSDSNYNRKREIKIFGPGGTPHKEDTQVTIVTSEFTNQLVGANSYFAVRTGAVYNA